VRLAKALADAGVASRRGAEALVFDGRVRVNGQLVSLPQTLVTPGTDTLEVDGKPLAAGIAAGCRHYYFALYKPAGYLCSNQTEGEKLVLDLFAAWVARWKERAPKAPGSGAAALPPRLFTVGRLDAATSGLLLVTNDGAWSQRVAHPSAGVTKEYVLTAAEAPTKRQLATMLAGCDVDGARVVPLRVERVATPDGGGAKRVLVELADGRNREVRRLAEAAGVDVRGLKRTRVGALRLPPSLRPGQFAELTFRQAKDVLDPELQAAARGGSVAEEAAAEAAAGEAPPLTPMMATKLRPVVTKS
jgi:pseudouridine synthase